LEQHWSLEKLATTPILEMLGLAGKVFSCPGACMVGGYYEGAGPGIPCRAAGLYLKVCSGTPSAAVLLFGMIHARKECLTCPHVRDS
jgi:hypothetical protein